MEKGQSNLDEGIHDENLLKSDGNLSEENPMHETKANTCDQKIANIPFIVTTRRNHDISSDVNGKDQPKVLEAHELNESKFPEENGNNYDSVSGDCYNKDNFTVEHEHADGVLLGDNDNATAVEDLEHVDGVVSGDDDNDTVAEDHDSVTTYVVTDEEDIAFSIKNLFSCIGGKGKKKDKNPYKTLTKGKEEEPPIDPFRQTQWKLLKPTHEHGVIPSHPPIKNLTCSEVHNSGITGASTDILVQSRQKKYGNRHTLNVHVEESYRTGHFANNWDVAHNCFDPNLYDFTHPHRGYAVLIVNQHFSRLDARNGADVDVQNTTKVLGKLGFFIKNKQLFDLDKQSALAVLRDAKCADHSRMDSFAFIISSHGNEIENPRNGKKEHAIYCSDDQYIFTNDILEMFSDENCPSLHGKPKLFFIQACRGAKTDSGIKITVDGRNRHQEHTNVHNRGRSVHHHGKNIDRMTLEPVKNAESDPLLRSVDDMDAIRFGDILDDNPIVHCNNDCLVMYAIPSGYFAWRSNVDGSWMLQYLWEEVKNYDLRTPCSFLKVLTAVSRKMAIRETNVPGNEKRSGKKAIPVIIHQLDKDIVFQEKTSNILDIQG